MIEFDFLNIWVIILSLVLIGEILFRVLGTEKKIRQTIREEYETSYKDKSPEVMKPIDDMK